MRLVPFWMRQERSKRAIRLQRLGLRCESSTPKQQKPSTKHLESLDSPFFLSLADTKLSSASSCDLKPSMSFLFIPKALSMKSQVRRAADWLSLKMQIKFLILIEASSSSIPEKLVWWSMMRTKGCRVQRCTMFSIVPRFVSKTSIICDSLGKDSFRYSPAPREQEEKLTPFWLQKNYSLISSYPPVSIRGKSNCKSVMLLSPCSQRLCRKTTSELSSWLVTSLEARKAQKLAQAPSRQFLWKMTFIIIFQDS